MTLHNKLIHFLCWVSIKANVNPDVIAQTVESREENDKFYESLAESTGVAIHELKAMLQFFDGLRGVGNLNDNQIKDYLTDNQIEFAKRVYEKYVEKEETEQEANNQ